MIPNDVQIQHPPLETSSSRPPTADNGSRCNKVTVSFFAIEIIHCVRTDNSSLRYRHTPLIAVGLIVCISNWIVRHDVKDHVCCSVIGDLVWLTRLENE